MGNLQSRKSQDWMLPIPGLQDWRIRLGSRDPGIQDCNQSKKLSSLGQSLTVLGSGLVLNLSLITPERHILASFHVF